MAELEKVVQRMTNIWKVSPQSHILTRRDQIQFSKMDEILSYGHRGRMLWPELYIGDFG